MPTRSHVPTFSRSHVLKVGGTPASEFRLIPFGHVEVDNPVAGESFEFTRAHADQALAWFRRIGRTLAIDWEHQSVGTLNRREDALIPAAGWIGGLEVRNDGLWATKVEWTQLAAEMLTRGEYRYFSPVIYWSDKQRTDLKSLGPVGLTNDPSMCGLHALAASRRSEIPEDVVSILGGYPLSTSSVVLAQGGANMDRIKELLGLAAEASLEEVLAAVTDQNRAQLAEVLGLPAEASIDDVKAAIRALAEGGQTQTEEAAATAAKRVVATIAKALNLSAVDTADALVAAIRKQRPLASTAQDSDGAIITALRRQVDEQEQAIELLRTANAQAEFRATTTSTEHAGKIPPADEEKYFKLFRTDRDMFDTVLRNMARKVGPQSLFTGRRGDIATNEPETEEGWKAAYKKSRELQQEFGDEQTYVAYMKAKTSGQVNILKR
jgi:phage I-like protein